MLCSVTISGVLMFATSVPAQPRLTQRCNHEPIAKVHASDNNRKSAEGRDTEFGLASWYGGDFQHRRTASGEPFDVNKLTAAHPTLPLNSCVLVTVLATGRSVVVRINDRGPFVGRRIIDLSAKAASDLGMKKDGVARVRIELAHASEAGAAGSGTATSKLGATVVADRNRRPSIAAPAPVATKRWRKYNPR